MFKNSKLINFAKSRLKPTSTAKTAMIYLGGGIVGRIMPFLLMPVLTRCLSPGDYGLYATFQSVLVLSMTFVGINLNGAIIRSYTKMGRDKFSLYLFNCLVLLFCSLLVVYFVFIVFGNKISDITKIPYDWLLIIPAIATLTFLFNNVLSIFRVESKAFLFCSWNIFYSICNLTVAVVLVVGFQMDWRGMVIGIITANTIFGTMALLFLLKKKYIRFGILKPYLTDALIFGSPLILHHLSTWVGSMLNRPLLNQFAGLEATGLFYTACTIASVINIFDAAFEQAWTPWLYRKLNEGTMEIKLKIVKITYLYLLVLLILVFAVSSLASLMIPWFLGSRFVAAGNYIFLVSLAYGFNAMKRSVFGYALYVNKSYMIGIMTIITTVIGVTLNYLLIKSNGALGAAFAMVGISFLSLVLTWIVASRVCPMPWNLLSASCSK